MFSKNPAYNGRKWGSTKQNCWFISVESSLIMLFASVCGGTRLASSLAALFGNNSNTMVTGLLKFPFCWGGYFRKKG